MSRNLRIFILIIISLVVFFAARLGLFIAYHATYANYGFGDIVLTFLRGMRFDLSIFLTITSIFWVLLLLPISNLIYQKIVLWLLFCVYVASAIFLAVDVNYFGYVGRHFANEPFIMGRDIGFAGDMIKGHGIQVIILIIIILICIYLWRKLINIPIKKETSWIKWIISFIIWCGIIFLLIRGGTGLKPISTIDAFASGDTNLGNLTLNGEFTAARFLSQKLFVNKNAYKFYSDDEAENIFMASHEKSVCNLPKDLQLKKPNIVLLLLESWSAYYVDFFGKNNFGLTPNMDRLASEGVSFTRHYSPERRSIAAIQGALTGIPPVSGMPSLGFGLETMVKGNIGSYFDKLGYDTIFIQSSKRRSFYMDAISKSLGFKHYYGMEDTKTILDYPDKNAAVFGWDHETYNLLADKLKNAKKPFFAFMFTGTTHIPYAPLPKKFMKYPEDREGEKGFKNTLYYADWSLGQFFESIKNEPWFNNTIFIMTADHDLGKYEKVNYPDNFRVPFVVWTPLMKHGIKIDNVTSHVDISPTILQLGGGGKDAGNYIGSSVFCKDNESYAVLNEYSVVGLIKADMFIRHSFAKVLDYEPKTISETDVKGMEKLLLAYYQVVFNRVFGSHR